MESMQKAEVVQLSRSYLSASPNEKVELEMTLQKYDGPIEPVIQELMTLQERQWKQITGVIKAEHFAAPKLREEYKDDLLYFYVSHRGRR